jgi:hypothetical protein
LITLQATGHSAGGLSPSKALFTRSGKASEEKTLRNLRGEGLSPDAAGVAGAPRHLVVPQASRHRGEPEDRDPHGGHALDRDQAEDVRGAAGAGSAGTYNEARKKVDALLSDLRQVAAIAAATEPLHAAIAQRDQTIAKLTERWRAPGHASRPEIM